MGEIAEDMIDGTACELCGQYFLDPEKWDYLYTHGHPVTCKECWEDLTPEEKEGRQCAIVDTM